MKYHIVFIWGSNLLSIVLVDFSKEWPKSRMSIHHDWIDRRLKKWLNRKGQPGPKTTSNDVEKTYWWLLENKEVEEDDTTITEVEVSIREISIESDKGFYCSAEILFLSDCCSLNSYE